MSSSGSTTARKAKSFIGTSGWSYPHWKEVFYPDDLPARDWLHFYARHFATVEINNTFYQLPDESTFQQWREQADNGFLYAVKASRYITHMKKLKGVEDPLERFLGRARLLGDSLGPILYQLPGNWRCNLARFEEFVALLPADLTHVFEFRHPSWFTDEVFPLLERRGLAFCIFSMPGLPCPVRATCRTVYIRFHGTGRLYGGKYSRPQLEKWARQIDGFLRDGREVYAYFNNDEGGYAVENALQLQALVPGKAKRAGAHPPMHAR